MARVNLTHYRLLTGDMGLLYPCGLIETLPGDVFRLQTDAMIRLSPMAAPVFHGMTVRVHHWFVPHRIVWPEFEDFMTQVDDDARLLRWPVTYGESRAKGDMLDHYGLSPDLSHIPDVVPLGYNAIFNRYYRDQDLVPERTALNGGPARIAWGKDYFTTCRPWPQKGPEVTIPLGDRAPIKGQLRFGTGSAALAGQGNTIPAYSAAVAPGAATLFPDHAESAYADLAEATGISISDFREALAMQAFQEDRARFGSRYEEVIRQQFGVRVRDARLQEPEYLGGGRARVNVSEVLQTAPEGFDPGDSPFGVGDMYGHGLGALRSRTIRRRIPEHGYIHSLLSVRPDPVYVNSTPRHFLRHEWLDFYTKQFAHIGQQEVAQMEVDGSGNADVFGYQDRYMEYRYQPSQVSGEFRDTLNYWHLARDFASPPALNQAFVECTPSKRIFNVQQEDVLWMFIQHRARALRRISSDPTPRILS